MKVQTFKRSTKRAPFEGLTAVTVTKKEAAELIESLAHQLHTGNPNSRRMESFDQEGRSFTIFVSDD